MALSECFDGWYEANMRPWVEDHAHMDESLRRRWSGQNVDLNARIPSDLIMAAAEVDSAISPAITPHITMTGLPACLDAVEPLAHAVFTAGWRPVASPGPTRAELADVIKSTLRDLV